MSSGTIAVELDARGMRCPLPVLRARRLLDEMRDGDILQITATDPASVRDVPAFCTMSPHTLLMAEVQDDLYIFEIQKRSDTSPDNEANDNIP